MHRIQHAQQGSRLRPYPWHGVEMLIADLPISLVSGPLHFAQPGNGYRFSEGRGGIDNADEAGFGCWGLFWSTEGMLMARHRNCCTLSPSLLTRYAHPITQQQDLLYISQTHTLPMNADPRPPTLSLAMPRFGRALVPWLQCVVAASVTAGPTCLTTLYYLPLAN